jgi:hypothetical protein
MNLNELILSIKNLSSDRDNSVSGLIRYFEDWKKNNKTVFELNNTIGKFRDGVFPDENDENKETLKKILKILYDFQNEVILNIGGMTMNERLYFFSLFERFDACKNSEKKEIICEKVRFVDVQS